MLSTSHATPAAGMQGQAAGAGGRRRCPLSLDQPHPQERPALPQQLSPPCGPLLGRRAGPAAVLPPTPLAVELGDHQRGCKCANVVVWKMPDLGSSQARPANTCKGEFEHEHRAKALSGLWTTLNNAIRSGGASGIARPPPSAAAQQHSRAGQLPAATSVACQARLITSDRACGLPQSLRPAMAFPPGRWALVLAACLLAAAPVPSTSQGKHP